MVSAAVALMWRERNGRIFKESTGSGFASHTITVEKGEDVVTKIFSLNRDGSRSFWILSAIGTLSEATLQASVPGEMKTYKGQFDISSLCGSFVPSETNGQQTGGLTLVLAAPNGQIFGGCVAGVLIAKSPVQVTVCSFVADGREEPAKSSDDSEASPTSSNASFGGMTGANRPQ